MLQKPAFVVLLATLCFMVPAAYAGKVELTTYYPAPEGEYNALQSHGSCVGSSCTAADTVIDTLTVKGAGAGTGHLIVTGDASTQGDLDVAGNAVTSGDLTVNGRTRVGGPGAKGFVIERGIPTSPEEGQVWIE